MAANRVPLHCRDYCAHILIPLNKFEIITELIFEMSPYCSRFALDADKNMPICRGHVRMSYTSMKSACIKNMRDVAL